MSLNEIETPIAAGSGGGASVYEWVNGRAPPPLVVGEWVMINFMEIEQRMHNCHV